MQKILVLILAILFVVLVGEGGYYFFTLSRKNITSPGTTTSSISPNPRSNTITPTIVSQQKEDKSGRTIIYDYKNPDGTAQYFSGVGQNNGVGLKTYIIGAFDHLEPVTPGFTPLALQNYYIYLNDPVKKTPFMKILVKKNETTFGVEYLTNPGWIRREFYPLQKTNFITKDDPIANNTLDKAIGQGDTVIVNPHVFRQTDKTNHISYTLDVDKTGAVVAEIIAVRRLEP